MPDLDDQLSAIAESLRAHREEMQGFTSRIDERTMQMQRHMEREITAVHRRITEVDADLKDRIQNVDRTTNTRIDHLVHRPRNGVIHKGPNGDTTRKVVIYGGSGVGGAALLYAIFNALYQWYLSGPGAP